MPTTKTDLPMVKRNPFEEPPLPKAFYHPGSPKRLSRQDRKTALSPDRRPGQGVKEVSRTVQDELFLSGSHRFSENNDPSAKDSSSKFDESWPSSDRPSLGDETMRESQTETDRFLSLRKRLEFREGGSANSSINKSSEAPVRDGDKGESVLAKYVERFRRGAPMSRQERQRAAGGRQTDFWWLASSPPNSSHGMKSSKTRTSVSPYKISSKSERLTASTLATHVSSRLPGDEQTRLLQERADRLLEQSYGSSEVSTEPVVSTEGLGSSPSSVSVVTDRSDERVYRPAFTRLARENSRVPQPPVPAVSRGSRPEDDILYQWRLKRKMELAKDSAHLARTPKPSSAPQQPTNYKLLEMDSKLMEFRQKLSDFTQPSPAALPVTPVTQAPVPPSVHFTPAPTTQPVTHQPTRPRVLADVEPEAYEDRAGRTATKSAEIPTIASPTLHRREKVKVKGGCPEPHLHLMCDILPCPHQKEYGRRRMGEDRGGSDTDEEETDVQYTQYLQAEKPDSDGKRSRGRQLTQRHDTEHSTGTKTLHTEEKANQIEEVNVTNSHTGGSSRQDVSVEESSDRKPARHKHSRSKTPAKQQLESDKRENAYGTGETTPAGQRLSRRPVKVPAKQHVLDSAIGEVVTDYLFDSSQNIVGSSVESLPPLSGGQGRLNSSTGANRTSPATAVEDPVETSSEGEEFADDKILQHLRQQRLEYETQLREIDELLSEMDVKR